MSRNGLDSRGMKPAAPPTGEPPKGSPSPMRHQIQFRGATRHCPCSDPICEAFERGWTAAIKWAREHPEELAA